VIKASFGGSTRAVKPMPIVSAVTSPGVKGNGKEINAVAQQKARQMAMRVISCTVKPAFGMSKAFSLSIMIPPIKNAFYEYIPIIDVFTKSVNFIFYLVNY
jgi:hypothetical protein